MTIELLFYAVVLLAVFAIFDLVVGVSNDAANFLNSSIGSRVAPRFVILTVASFGIMLGVGFSSGMMEVARKGIFHPQLFTMPELLTLFLGVMLADVILLDMFNSLSLPTSTTVSIVFELLGSAVVISTLKLMRAQDRLANLPAYINSSKALIIVGGILLSVVVAFVFGALAQICSRLLFTFDYWNRLRRYGGVWGGVAMASITYFILVKGVKGTSFVSAEGVDWIQDHTFGILAGIFVVSAVLLQGLVAFQVNILKPIILIGTFALAMAFAANDLMNFIGVPMAGYHAYEAAIASGEPLTGTMEVLAGKVPSETYLLLLAGVVMVITLWVSRKARSVQSTEVNLAQQTEREEHYESTLMSRAIVRMAVNGFRVVWLLVPTSVQRGLERRLVHQVEGTIEDEGRPSFDLLRASVNLMVAAAVISYATSHKLPLSTTYVTFMVAMGTSFADQAWGRDSAVYRVTGVLTVIGGWFMTALLAFTVAGFFALIIYAAGAYGVLFLLGVVAVALWRNHVRHSERARSKAADEIFNLKKVADVRDTVATTFEHMGRLVQEIRESLDVTFEALFIENIDVLRTEEKRSKKIQRWTNIVTANVFKALRLLQMEGDSNGHDYAQTVRRLQKLADGHRDIVMRSYLHVRNHHKGLLPLQVDELQEVRQLIHDLLQDLEATLKKHRPAAVDSAEERDRRLRALAKRLNERQIGRIGEGTSKTRLSILYYAIVGNVLMISKQSLRLLHSFDQSFHETARELEFDLD